MNVAFRTRTIFLSFLLLAAWACGEAPGDQPPADVPAGKAVETAPARPVDFQETIFATGRLSSREEMRLSFKTGGIIRRMHVREGQTVRQGQLLAELDLDEIGAQTEQARLGRTQAGIGIENAELALRLAERDYQNVQGLYRDSVATLVQLQNAEIALDNARNQLEAAKTGLDVSDQQVTVATFNLKHSKITAPADGVILKKLAEPNELAGPGTPVFLFGSRDKAQVINVHLTDKDIIHVRLDDEADITFDAYPRHSFRGVVRELAGMADPYTGTYEVEIEVIAGDKTLFNGFIGSVHIHTGERRQLLQIPVDALVTADERTGQVFVVRDQLARRATVDIERIRDGYLLIDSGLQAGDAVIISGAGYLEDGQAVRPKIDTGLTQVQ